MKSITASCRDSIVSLLGTGLSAQRVAKRLGISVSTVTKYKKLHLPNAPVPQGGRVAKLTSSKKCQIKRSILNGSLKTAAEVHRSLVNEGYELSYMTVTRALKSMGFEAKLKKKKPFLSKKHQAARLKWAKEHASWTENDWKRVVFSDETKINIWGSDGVKYCWIRPGDPMQPHHLDLTVKHGGGSLMMWGCMTYKGIGYGCHIQETMDSKVYCDILETSFKDTLDYWDLSLNDVIFQQDNDPKHTSKKTKEWLEAEGVRVLPWPAQSPDLNPIEHMWHYLKLRLSTYERKATSIHELWERVDKEWNDIAPDMCKRCIDSMPARVKAVIASKGGYTKY